ncbi:D-serine ammonia-lyase [Ureibacillus sp. NPDC094379]
MQEKDELIKMFPLLDDVRKGEAVLWMNPNKQKSLVNNGEFSFEMVNEAEKRLQRFASYIKVAFPQTADSNGIIESPIKEIPSMKKLLEDKYTLQIPGNFLMKCDYSLPISGSIKARGGIYELLKYAETLALQHGHLSIDDDYAKLYDPAFKEFFSQFKIAVGSTGNLGLSIGIMGAKLGFQVTVHMSHDAKSWKKQMLRDKGVHVIEYESDYSLAVEEGRKQAELDPTCHFIDDENSVDLFAGYAVAALRLQQQLQEVNIQVDENHPLFVYLPCGVGGGPGGVAYGLKAIYGEHVHIFFGEPLQSPCMLIGMMTGLHDEIAVSDIGLTNITEADGLAVGRASKFVGKMMDPIISGCYTVDDAFLFCSLREMYEQENIFMEPSAHAGVFGPIQMLKEEKDYLETNNLVDKMTQSTHIIWSTGGDMVPTDQRQEYLQKEIR